MFISLTAIALITVSANLNDVPAADDTVSTFIAQKRAELAEAEKAMNQLGLDKGHDKSANDLLLQVAPQVDMAKGQLKELEGTKAKLDDALATAKKLDAQTRALSRQITRSLSIASGLVKTVEGLTVSGPKTFPERCSIMLLGDEKGEARIQKAGFKKERGIIEQDHNRQWVLSIGDEKAAGGLRRVVLDEQVGLIGSKDPSSGMLVKSLTPKDMFVTALVDPAKNKVMCVSQPQKVQ